MGIGLIGRSVVCFVFVFGWRLVRRPDGGGCPSAAWIVDVGGFFSPLGDKPMPGGSECSGQTAGSRLAGPWDASEFSVILQRTVNLRLATAWYAGAKTGIDENLASDKELWWK
jgi:hypothetical protein